MGYPNNHYLQPTPGGSYYPSAEISAYRERGGYPPLSVAPGTDWRDYTEFRRDYDRPPDRRPPPSSSTNNS